MTKKLSDYEIDKQKKKQLLVRNEFLYHENSIGKYDFPLIKKQNRNVSGLNAKDFNYFDYDDPYLKDQITKCSICGSPALQDQFGNGECKNCGWKFSKDEETLEQKTGISYPMLVSPTTAREQYKKGLPFKATFNEFVNGLYFYSEMIFDYNGTTYEVFLKKDYTIVFCSNDMQQEYKTRQDFENKANINGILLKSLWDKINNPSFTYCS
ncbi:MAG: hypothetical protein ACI4M6_03475 [Christensenellaceae bacterium]